MKINTRREEKKFIMRLRSAKLVLALARLIRTRFVTRLIDRYCYFGNTTERLQIVAPYHNDLLIHLDVHSFIERKILCTGYFEPWIAKFLLRSLKPGFVAIDVGANIGVHTLVMAHAVGQAGRVLAFEPNPKIFERLKSNIDLNRFHHVKAFSTALSYSSGSTRMFVPVGADFNQGLGSMHRDNLETQCEEISATTRTLDSVVSEQQLDRVDLIKCDVEGHELHVFSGATETLLKFKPIIIFEYSERQYRHGGFSLADVENLLSKIGYSLFVMRREYTTSIKYGVPDGECDILALPA